MKILKMSLQLVGIMLLVPIVVMATLRFDNRNADGPSIIFPGGELVSGDLHTGQEPDWTFTNEVQTIELQLEDTLSSSLIWIVENEGRIYVVSKYMSSTLGRMWKHWAVAAESGSGLAVIRVGDIRYERKLLRLDGDDIPNGLSAKMTTKYSRGQAAPETILADKLAIQTGDTWVFELAAR